jgi:hypothetical protein
MKFEDRTDAALQRDRISGHTFVFAIRDTKKFIENWQYQKEQKQGIKVQELYPRP